jgi:hypothetical protein
MIDRPIFVCATAECQFIGGAPEHMDHVEQTSHWTYQTINPNGSIVSTRLALPVREAS